MADCAACHRPIRPAEIPPVVRAEGGVYHIGCAPVTLIEASTDEYRAIVRKGIRYFVEKYGEGSVPESDLGRRFLELGIALEAERDRRERR
jgi:hypothetical protein